jgi:peptide/nickel transport system ATP-binding protein
MSALLSVERHAVSYRDGENHVQAVGGVDPELLWGRSLGIVGESGSGKTTLALAFLRLLPPNAGIKSGSVMLDGEDVLALDEPRLIQ